MKKKKILTVNEDDDKNEEDEDFITNEISHIKPKQKKYKRINKREPLKETPEELEKGVLYFYFYFFFFFIKMPLSLKMISLFEWNLLL